MRKTATKISKVKINGQPFWCLTWPKIGKGRNRQFFKDKTEAATVLQQKLIEQENYGIAGVSFNERHRAEYLECAELLQPFGATIREAVKFYIPHLQAMKFSCTAAQLVDELLKVKEADGASRRYLSDLRSRLNQFSEIFDGKPIAEITSTEIDEWLRSLSDKETGKRLSPITRNNFRRLLIVAFNFARGRNYCADNPAKKTAKAKVIQTPIGILSVNETVRLLENAPTDLVPYLSIGAFGGLRRSVFRQVRGRGIECAPVGRESKCDEPGLDRVGDPYGNVDTFLEQVDLFDRHVDVDGDVDRWLEYSAGKCDCPGTPAASSSRVSGVLKPSERFSA